MEIICRKCGGRGVVFAENLEKSSEAQPKRITRYMIGSRVKSALTKLRYRFVKATTKVFGIIPK
jgi:hypothetical protein